MKHWIKKTALTLACGSLLLTNGCTTEELKKSLSDFGQTFGWLESEEKPETLEQDLNLGLSDNANLPSKVDLSDKFPPIGDQGQYGTCVAWATGYSLKAYLEAVDHKYSQSQLADPARQFSPKDLFWAIPSSQKGGNCNGTNFEYALDQQISRGIAPLSVVPYTDLGSCSAQPQSAWTAEANKYKLDNYRKIDLKVNDIKNYLAQGRPVVFGAKLGYNFMGWKNETVLSSDEPGYDGQHAYHALIVSGYDDAKGANGAFRVVNSWGTTWGDAGHIWVDYNFFVNDFAFCAFVAKNKRSDNYNPDPDGDNNVDPNDIEEGVTDLVAWELTDTDNEDETDPRKRSISYNVYNVGSETIPASKDWSICYIYYNAYDANDFGILLYDYYTNDLDNAEHNGPIEDPNLQKGISGNWFNKIDVPGGKSVAEALYGEGSFSWGYTMPADVTGKYYLILIADAFENITEKDESNNFFYATDANGKPIDVQNGVISVDFTGKNGDNLGFKPNKRPEMYAKSPNPTMRNANNVNTYTPQEIRRLITAHKKSGLLQQKIAAFAAQHGKALPKQSQK